jgi:hypothetical protein
VVGLRILQPSSDRGNDVKAKTSIRQYLQENTASSKPLKDFIRQLTTGGSAANGNSLKRSAAPAAEKAGSR